MESTETEVKTPVAVSKEALIRVVHERDDEKRREAILTILGLDTEASIKEIDRAFRQFALNHHPDAGGDRETFNIVSGGMELLRAWGARNTIETPLFIMPSERSADASLLEKDAFFQPCQSTRPLLSDAVEDILNIGQEAFEAFHNLDSAATLPLPSGLDFGGVTRPSSPAPQPEAAISIPIIPIPPIAYIDSRSSSPVEIDPELQVTSASTAVENQQAQPATVVTQVSATRNKERCCPCAVV